ncbi:MAG: hypothetical protein A2589_01730 [Candidatus Vogelbacteria bacterium RIFOXYD1_FULL_46_19]|uniref:Uncharacterized protein n=1 Tax=Candidatus Vogelbacteria bacterium RIFOXYD1_FULL_46_19 TaxID=1802439 RepID=A0A1G2QGS4_9BACT|nr:MAG: hypothetical protein A2589_01730 [Candidatus Vogelbacteria bacterium RIFOXYD1_FULL_46_19]
MSSDAGVSELLHSRQDSKDFSLRAKRGGKVPALVGGESARGAPQNNPRNKGLFLYVGRMGEPGGGAKP